MTIVDQRKVDLHVHSSASDGFYKPEEVVAMARRSGLAAIALTDHDTVEGVEPALREGRRIGLEVIPGVEISAELQGMELHILGYWHNLGNTLAAFLKSMRRERFQRMQKMLQALQALGIILEWPELLLQAGKAAPGRLHLARLMVKKKKAGSVEEAFYSYLGEGCPAYVPRRLLQADQAIALLLGSAALPVLAHPGPGGLTLLEKLLPFGLAGVEVFHPEHNAEIERCYMQKARRYNLLVTGGSDFHGDLQGKLRHLGSAATVIPYSYLEKLKQALTENKISST